MRSHDIVRRLVCGLMDGQDFRNVIVVDNKEGEECLKIKLKRIFSTHTCRNHLFFLLNFFSVELFFFLISLVLSCCFHVL